MTDSPSDKSRKTLSLKPREENSDKPGNGTRMRTGARARHASFEPRRAANAAATDTEPAAPQQARRAAPAPSERRNNDRKAEDRPARQPHARQATQGTRSTDTRGADTRRASDTRRSPDTRPGAGTRHGADTENRTDRPRREPAKPGSRDTDRRNAPARPQAARPERSDRPARQPGREPRQSAHHAAPAQRQAAVPDSNGLYAVFAPCPQGLEQSLADELLTLGYADVRADRAGCRFRTDWTGIMRANLHSRLATRILVQVGQAPVHHEDDILALARSIPWERWFGPEQTLRVDTSAIRSPMQSLQYCNLRAKDGICDRLREREGARPDVDTVRPDARVHLFLTEDTGTLYLDTSGESLFKRGWRFDKGEAPLRENLAAGMLALSGWTPGHALLDPFCGSGTILIEAAHIALGIPPGISRPFGFMRLRDHDKNAWHALKDAALATARTQAEAPLIGFDINADAIAAARQNLLRSTLPGDVIRFEQGDARTIDAPATQGWIIANPPYGERMTAQDGAALWPAWASNLKQKFGGWQLHAISSDLDLPKHLRLKPLRRTPLRNGALDCRLFAFELVQESYRDNKTPKAVADDQG